jgi:hypothetical protein
MRELAAEQARRDNWWEQFMGDEAFLREFDPDLRGALPITVNDQAPTRPKRKPQLTLFETD